MTPQSTAISLGIACASGAGLLAYSMFTPKSGLLCRTVWRGPSHHNHLALTFDDGPWPGSTEHVLDILHARGCLATFFVIGRYAKASPHLIRRIHAEGHQLANHTFDHHRAGLFRHTQYWVDQIRRTDDVIADITGARPLLFRPPMGFKSPPMAWALARTGHRVVTWSRRAGDGITTTSDRILNRLRNLDGGDIVLMHDGRDPASGRSLDATLAALPTLLNDLADQQLSLVTLDRLFA